MSIAQEVLKVVTRDLEGRFFGFVKESVETGINLSADALKTLNAQHNGFAHAMNVVADAVNWFVKNPNVSSLPESFVAAAHADRKDQEALNAQRNNNEVEGEALDPITVTSPSIDSSSTPTAE